MVSVLPVCLNPMLSQLSVVVPPGWTVVCVIHALAGLSLDLIVEDSELLSE